MDAVLRNFKSIPCPSGDRCSDTSCQWQHSWEKLAAEAALAHTGLDGSRDDDGPRKRQKVSEEEHGPVRESSLPLPLPSTTTKPISPPPLKRKAPPPTAGDSNPFKTPKPKPNVFSTPPPKSIQKITPPMASPRKPEALNPRHLKAKAPATHDFRLKALKMLFDQFERLNNEVKKSSDPDAKNLLLSAQEVIWLALDEEEKIATDKPSIYNNVIKNQIMTYKRFTTAQWIEERKAELKKKEPQDITTSGKNPSKPLLGPPKEINTGLTPSQEVEFLKFLETPIAKLALYGYIPTPPSDADIAKARAGEEASRGWEECDRCGSRFQVFPGRREEDGALTSGGECTYHFGRSYYPERSVGKIGQPEKRYRCCGLTVGESPGCVKAPTHVFKANAPSRLAALVPFVETPPNPFAPKDRAVCFDCEMGYTVRGMELIRLTATSWPDGKELLDVLVHPIGEILDLNSRFSGVWPQDIVSAEPWSADDSGSQQNSSQTEGRSTKKKMQIVPSIMAARELLFSLISPETPLIGHGLENDLNAVRIVHPTIIDTILLYPHKRGLPIRNGLKMLMEQHLNKAIQVETGSTAMGHDSAEDARAAGELVRLKVQNEWKQKRSDGWTLEDGVFLSPFDRMKARDQGALTETFLEQTADKHADKKG